MVMATFHVTPISTSITTISQLAPSKASSNPKTSPPSLDLPCQKASVTVQRRSIISLTITGAILGLNVDGKKTLAAARRPPPAPAQEKKDPNVSGVQAKVLASRKRKEAMKQAMAEQRARGKPVLQQ